eukprot:m.241426 g.241426  ORF g.241426 m.241426 type:complete len:498 (+) comp18999_c0_seq3:1810-3303(+)
MARSSKASGGKDDPMLRDGKRLPMAKMAAALPSFVGWLVIGLPLVIGVLLPLTLLSQLVLAVLRAVGVKQNKAAQSVVGALEGDEAKYDATSVVQRDARTYDLVLFGATGFTGQLAAKYLASKYGAHVRWALAGRRLSALEAVRNELKELNPALAGIPLLVADVNDPASLRAVVRNTKVVISTVGPFQRYGTRLVQLCALLGTDYCDITGESDWVRQMIDSFDETAQKSGARIVHFCGHDCVPWDLAVMEVARILREEKNEELASVSCYDEIRGSASGGTLETIFVSLEGRKPVKSSLGFDPMLKSQSAEKSGHALRAKNQSFLGYSSERGSWVGPFVMAMVMANCIRRSNALNGYGTKLKYHEAVVFPSFFAGFVTTLQLMVFAMALFCPPLKWCMRKVLPKPGQGPSVASMDKGFLKIEATGTGVGGSKASVGIYFPTDPGYRDTARMLVESGLCFVQSNAQIPAAGGVFTPAACQGRTLLQRLENTGTEYFRLA